MSAYGAILTPTRTAEPLPTTRWRLNATSKYTPSHNAYLTIYHLTLSTAQLVPGLVEYLHRAFADELMRGMTYPQEIQAGEEYTLEMFQAYYFAADVLVAVMSDRASEEIIDGAEVQLSIKNAVDGRTLEECIAGCYYVKPNYPGRSSHICNAGFLVPPSQRGRGVGAVLARSYLYYAPKLGYEASVFNLVYVNNTASVRLWEALGFTKAGLIPRAGRLRKQDGSEGEEFIDAYVFYRRFDQ
ncbi:acyl-CoA N-acyltransferase [Daedalea quercina L-15889]|uniref:Acyl-CoA N-acyltransferase n=1 Tax=Daedalea quercina L-15889 TaxID=1314783 RepID=A0A165SPT7_9APHY|nr:acyl-CoA N-acyltransferase [Daedalea quercina L-15889]